LQIRELDLKELEIIYPLIEQLRPALSYKEFEDLIYDMRYMEYKMIGIMDKGELITYAGVAIQTNLYHKRHLYVFDLVSDKNFRNAGYGLMMLEYLYDYAKMGMCESVVISSDSQKENSNSLYEKQGFIKNRSLFVKSIT